VGETEEVEGFRAPDFATSLPVPEGEPPELDESRLAGMQFQAKLRETIAQLHQKPLRVDAVLESNDEVVSIAHDDYLPRACFFLHHWTQRSRT